ncbi:MAG: toll/interleukin-1 receptor domain-containing protein [Oscillospiraceae bacterium]|nr:toll/interleukin-1 receptor domain-containing protein [Oscillospiraceae bacterium]
MEKTVEAARKGDSEAFETLYNGHAQKEYLPMKNGEKYDIFLSYRRDGGEAMAILLHDRLSQRGYKVFLDIENLNSGSFNTRLLDIIDNCTDFLLICSKDSFERCNNEGDWVRMEIAHALSKGKNIVPVMLRNFEFPDELPADIEAIRVQNGVNANSHEYFDAAVDRLTDKFLISKPMSEVIHAPVKKKKTLPLIIGGAAGVLALVVFVFVTNFGGGRSDPNYNNQSSSDIVGITAADIDGMWELIGFYDSADDYSWISVDEFIGFLSFSQSRGGFYDSSGLVDSAAGEMSAGDFSVGANDRIIFTLENGSMTSAYIFFDADGDLCIQMSDSDLIFVYRFEEE